MTAIREAPEIDPEAARRHWGWERWPVPEAPRGRLRESVRTGTRTLSASRRPASFAR
jgi:hypothetical protein